MSLDPSQRATLAQLADSLIPAGDGFPAASQAGVAGEQLDQLLAVRPDLLPGLKKLLDQAAGKPASDVIRQLRASDPAAFGVLAEVVPGAYFLHAEIRAKLGYQGQGPRPIDPRPDYEDLLQSVLDRGPIYRPTVQPGAYNWRESYDWNFQHVPGPRPSEMPAVPGEWVYAGLPVASPLGIAAGPLLNGAWILYYASLGFDVLTYKTVRSRVRACYAMPNLQPVTQLPIAEEGGRKVRAVTTGMRGSWAVSFGMPSKDPLFWRADIESTRHQLPKAKILAVSVVATPEPDWTLDHLAADFAQCARWAAESGADCIEANFSCPNVASADAQLYQQPEQAAVVAQAIRAAIGRRPLLIKIGHVTHAAQARELSRALAPHAAVLVMVNCISAQVTGPDGQPLFQGEKRGIAGAAIRAAALEQVRLFAQVLHEENLNLRLIGVGGIASAADVRDHLQAGAQGVQLATAAMLDPQLGLRLRRELASPLHPS